MTIPAHPAALVPMEMQIVKPVMLRGISLPSISKEGVDCVPNGAYHRADHEGRAAAPALDGEHVASGEDCPSYLDNRGDHDRCRLVEFEISAV